MIIEGVILLLLLFALWLSASLFFLFGHRALRLPFIWITASVLLLILSRAFLVAADEGYFLLTDVNKHIWWHGIFALSIVSFVLAGKRLSDIVSDPSPSSRPRQSDIFVPSLFVVLSLLFFVVAGSLDGPMSALFEGSFVDRSGLHHFIVVVLAGIAVRYVLDEKTSWDSIASGGSYPFVVLFILLSFQHFWELLSESWQVIPISASGAETVEQFILLPALVTLVVGLMRVRMFAKYPNGAGYESPVAAIVRDNKLVATLLFMSAVLVLWFMYLPRLVAYPKDFSYNAEIIAVNDLNDPVAGYAGEERQTATFSVETAAAEGGILGMVALYEARSLSGDLIFSVARDYRIDAHTSMHEPDGRGTNRAGYLFAPRMTGLLAQVPDQSPFTYWHVHYDAPALMKFRDTEIVHGLTTYRYAATLTVDQTEETAHVLGVGTTVGVVADVDLELWIDPLTGQLVAYEDRGDRFYYDLATNARLHHWSSFHNTYTPASIEAQVARIQNEQRTMFLTVWSLPSVLLLLFMLIFIFRAIKRSSRRIAPVPSEQQTTEVSL